jgi:hypothetical protein
MYILPLDGDKPVLSTEKFVGEGPLQNIIPEKERKTNLGPRV